jgi:hypothetical protein
LHFTATSESEFLSRPQEPVQARRPFSDTTNGVVDRPAAQTGSNPCQRYQTLPETPATSETSPQRRKENIQIEEISATPSLPNHSPRNQDKHISRKDLLSSSLPSSRNNHLDQSPSTVYTSSDELRSSSNTQQVTTSEDSSPPESTTTSSRTSTDHVCQVCGEAFDKHFLLQ